MSKSPAAVIGSETPLPHPVPASDELGPLVGQTFGGYEVTSYIGEGPTGAVYRAEDLTEQRMALKVMHKELSRKEAADHLWTALKKLSETSEPHFVKVYDSGFGDEGQFFYAMEELVGMDLETGLDESGALAPQKALEIVRQVCRALESAHALGIVHGGLKPRNVFLVPSDSGLTVRVLDFGAGRLAGGAEKGVIVGNPFYMAPEQFGGTADAHTDVYSLGVLMYELFSGSLPFSGPSHGQVMMRHLAEVPSTPPGCDEELSKIILRALVKTPAGRYGSVKQVEIALERWASSRPAMLGDAAAFQVIARAAEARAMKQAALSTPDATAPMPKMDLAELARGTRQEVIRELPPLPVTKGRKVMNVSNDKKNGADNPNSSESVEASLEDFISQANASFPQATSDGWDLHTGDVELVDEADDQLESAQHMKAPVVIPHKEATPAPSPRVSRQMPVAAPAPAPDPELEAAAAAMDITPASGERRKVERTEVVSSPLHVPSTPWTANPLVIIGGLLAAFIVGAGVVFYLVKSMMPSGPVVVQQPVLVPAPAAAAPVVTPLPQQPATTAQPVAAQPVPVAAQPVAAQPVVTPIPQPVAAQLVAPAPAPEAPKKRVAAPKKHNAPAAAPVEHAEKRSAPAPKHEASGEKPAAKKVEKKSSGGDWVDPFAQ